MKLTRTTGIVTALLCIGAGTALLVEQLVIQKTKK